MKAALLTLVMIAALASVDAAFDPQPLPELRTTYIVPVGEQPHTQAVIFPADYAAERDMHLHFYGADVASYWTPTVEQVTQFEASLPVYLRTTADGMMTFWWDKPRIEQILTELDDYHVQYIGVVIDDERMMFANYACNVELRHLPDWGHALWVVMDGGACYFQMAYLPDKHLYTWLSINGEA